MDPVFHYILACSFSLVFMSAAFNKIQHFSEFYLVLQSYRLLPAIAVTAVSVLITVIELGVAAGLLISDYRSLAAVFAGALLIVYALAMAINLYRGNGSLNCGCHLGEASESAQISKWLVARNFILALGILAVTIPVNSRDVGGGDIALIILGLAIAGLAYGTVNQLMVNHSRYQEIR